MFKKIFVFLLVYFLAFYPVLAPLANASAKGDIEVPSTLAGEGRGEGELDNASKIRVQQTFGRLPLYFIQNNGQIDEKVKFYEKGSGHATYFTEEGVYLALQAPDSRLQTPDSRLG